MSKHRVSPLFSGGLHEMCPSNQTYTRGSVISSQSLFAERVADYPETHLKCWQIGSDTDRRKRKHYNPSLQKTIHRLAMLQEIVRVTISHTGRFLRDIL